MQLIRLVPAGQPDGTRRRWTVAASVVLHLVAFALIIGIAARPRLPAPQTPSYDLVFEPSPATEAQSQGQPPPQADVPAPDDALPGPPAPPPSSPPVPDGVATSVPEAAVKPPAPSQAQTSPPPVPQSPPPQQATAAPAPVAPPVPRPPTTTPPPAPATPAHPAPTTAAPQLAFAPPPPQAEVALEPEPTEIVPLPAPPTVRLETPQEEAPPVPQPTPIMPQPPPPLPPIPRAPPRPRVPRAAPGTFGSPMDLSFGPPPPRPEARGSRSRTIDLSLGPPREGPNRSDPYAQIRAANASADWNRGLLAYWLRHRYYPREAEEAGEDGNVTIELTVARSGRVEAVSVVSRSGSQWLDMAAVSTFRDAQLPPFTPEMPQDRITFQIPINYILIRH